MHPKPNASSIRALATPQHTPEQRLQSGPPILAMGWGWLVGFGCPLGWPLGLGLAP